MSEAQQAQPVTASTETTQLGLLDQIVEDGRFGKDAAAKERGKDLVKQFVSEVLEGQITVGRDTEAMINARIAQIDHLLSLQLNEVLHAPEFQKLEATWRGLQYLLKQSETGVMLKIKVLNVSKKDLHRDLTRALEFNKSGQDMELLEKISQVAAGAHAPFLSAAAPEMFNVESYTQIDQPRDLAKIFDTTEYAKWKSFRQSEDSRYVALTAPRILMRLPYGQDTTPVDGFNYEEGVDGT